MQNLDIIKSKVHTRESLSSHLSLWRLKCQKIVFTNGCFDLLHLGHIDYLSKAADLGDVLIIGINTDSSVKCLGKGLNRPIQDENSRSLIIAALHFVSAVVLFGESTPLSLIQFIQPDILVKGADYHPENIVGYDIVKEKGGEVKTIPFLEGYSTSSIERKIKFFD